MIIKIDSTTITNKKIIKYQKEEIYHSILNSPPLQPSPINTPNIKPKLISPKKPTLTKPLTTLKQI